MAAIANEQRGTNWIIEAAGELMAEDARMHSWMSTHVRDLSEVERWNVDALARVHLHACRDVWEQYRAMSREERTAGHARVLEVFNGVRAELRTIRETGRVDYRDPAMPPDAAG